MPVPASSQHLNTHVNGGGHLSLKKPAGDFEKFTLFGKFHLYGCHEPICRYPWVSPVTDGSDSLGERNTCRYCLWRPCWSSVLCPRPGGGVIRVIKNNSIPTAIMWQLPIFSKYKHIIKNANKDFNFFHQPVISSSF